ncbi:uncharacterized protein LOC104424546 [Eucalyptus grandis]|uniref:uncharacterized protein LOC104424546 n=1 Tax=Eucalyptus grandis TaxID=71139 RepID=UPI00192E95E1|nr:uncharacterized protein LOC104424546 [Eucalyptus grandis]
MEVSLPKEHNDTPLLLAFRRSIPMLNTSSGNLVATLDWMIVENRTCKEAGSNKSSYACAGQNTKCEDSGDERGHICICEDGYKDVQDLVHPVHASAAWIHTKITEPNAWRPIGETW